jgi:hypothetical protein
MQLLLRRRIHTPSINLKSKFILWAKFEVSPEEEQLLTRYKASFGYLTIEQSRHDLWRAFFIALGIAFVVALVLEGVPGRIPLAIAIISVFVTFGLAWYIIYEQLREAIRISDMLAGRTFKDKSLVLMARRERRMVGYAHVFVNFLEELKEWEGTEIIQIGEDEQHESALRLVTDTFNAAA